MNVYEAVEAFYQSYGGEKKIIGKSVEGRSLFAFRIGRGEPVGISQYALHAREWITAYLGLEHVRRGVPRGSVWIIPLMNPDGALLCTEGLARVSKARRDFLKELSGDGDFSLWKANIEGVDLNVNFDARWGTGARNLRFPAPENYIGEAPFSAPESRALSDFTLQVNPQFTVSWHTKGEEIYWHFFQPLFRRLRDKRLARVLSRSTGYPLCSAGKSAGGYKDWCVEKLKIPAFTVEVGSDAFSHPLGFETLDDIKKHNLDALVHLTEGY